MDKDKYDVLFKIILIGDSGVGKSNILSRCVNEDFNLESKSTIGVEFNTKTCFINDTIVKLQIWDTSGQERFRAITTAYYRGAHGIILVYDTTSKKSFENLALWFHEIEIYAEDVPVIIVGNKIDLINLRQISYEDGLKYATQKKSIFMETSALTNDNIEKSLELLVEKIMENYCNKLENEHNENNSLKHLGINSLNIRLDDKSYHDIENNNKKKCCNK